MRRALLWCMAALCCAGCAGADGAGVDAEQPQAALAAAQLGFERGGAVFTQTNEAGANRVLAFARDDSGELAAAQAFATGGKGSGDALGSQGALVLSEHARFLLAVNAGSNDVSSFAVRGAQLELVDRVGSGGMRPISVTERRGLVYVLNAGAPANVTGFFLDARGRLQPIDHAMQPLSADAVAPAQVELSPDSRTLVVTEKDTNLIDTYAVTAFGRIAPPQLNASAGTTPFGFEFTREGDLIVSEAATGSMSSYALHGPADLRLITGPIGDTQVAPCWVAVAHDDRYAYTTNAGSGSISSYSVARSGAIELLDARAGELREGSKPLDMAFDARGRYLYALDAGNSEIASFSAQRDGSLDPLSASEPLPHTAAGLSAY